MKRENVITLLVLAAQRLARAGCDSPILDAEILLAHALRQNRAWLYAHPTNIPAQSHLDKFCNLLARREQREPVAYLVGHKEFFALDFEVTPHVLIPRPDTELLVETAIAMNNEQIKGGGRIVDVGTGSGCIAVTLAKHLPAVRLIAVDRSVAALSVARRNAVRHEVMDRISFVSGDLLQALTGPFEMIVSNPPYVSRAELADTSPEVNQYEPHLALNGGKDGLNIVRRLLAQGQAQLKPGGSLLVEIGAAQGNAVTHLAQTHFPQATISLKKDLAGRDRLLVVTSPS